MTKISDKLKNLIFSPFCSALIKGKLPATYQFSQFWVGIIVDNFKKADEQILKITGYR